jgi:hypothetical protein
MSSWVIDPFVDFFAAMRLGPQKTVDKGETVYIIHSNSV